EEILANEINDDYVFVHLLDEATVLSPMDKVRSIYPNAMHVTRENLYKQLQQSKGNHYVQREKMTDIQMFKAFYEEVKGIQPSEETEEIFTDVLEQLMIRD